MKDKFKEFIKFTSSSLASTVVDLGLFALLIYFLRGQLPTYYILVSTVIARIVSILVNYYLNANVVFKEKKERELPFAKYIVLAIFDMLASALFVTLLVGWIPVHETLIKMLVDSILFFVGYIIQRKFIF